MHKETIIEDDQLASLDGNPVWHGYKDDSSGSRPVVWAIVYQSDIEERPIVETSVIEEQAEA